MNTKFKTVKEYNVEIERVKKVLESTSNWKMHRDQGKYLSRLEKERSYLIYGKRS